MKKLMDKIFNSQMKEDYKEVRINMLQSDVDRIIMALEDSEEDNEYLISQIISQLQKHASEYMGGKAGR